MKRRLRRKVFSYYRLIHWGIVKLAIRAGHPAREITHAAYVAKREWRREKSKRQQQPKQQIS